MRAPPILLLSLASLIALPAGAQAPSLESARVAPFAVTPSAVVVDMLKLAGVGANDYVVDLGSGDGRLVIAAAAQFGARGGFGVDIDEKLVAYANGSAAKAGVGDRVGFFARDLFATDVSEATVVTIYLFPAIMAKVGEKLRAELHPGARVVSHDFPIPGWPVERIAVVQAPEKTDTVGTKQATLYLYVVPPRSTR